MPNLPILEKDTRLLAARPGEFQHRGRAAHAFELDDIGDVQVAKRALEFLLLLRAGVQQRIDQRDEDRKSTRLNSSHANISYAVFCLKKKKKHRTMVFE